MTAPPAAEIRDIVGFIPQTFWSTVIFIIVIIVVILAILVNKGGKG